MSPLLAFFLGLVAGGICGMVGMALGAAAGRGDRR